MQGGCSRAAARYGRVGAVSTAPLEVAKVQEDGFKLVFHHACRSSPQIYLLGQSILLSHAYGYCGRISTTCKLECIGRQRCTALICGILLRTWLGISQQLHVRCTGHVVAILHDGELLWCLELHSRTPRVRTCTQAQARPLPTGIYCLLPRFVQKHLSSCSLQMTRHAPRKADEHPYFLAVVEMIYVVSSYGKLNDEQSACDDQI